MTTHGQDWDLFTDIRAINAWIDNANPRDPHEDSMRVMKIGEEYGEAVAAYIGMTGQNPRKGVTHTEYDLLNELADVAITALCAMEHFTGQTAVTRALLASKITAIIVRANISPVPEQSPATATAPFAAVPRLQRIRPVSGTSDGF